MVKDGLIREIWSKFLSVNPKDRKEYTRRYSMRRVSPRKDATAAKPLGAVHLKNKRLKGLSRDIRAHQQI